MISYGAVYKMIVQNKVESEQDSTGNRYNCF